MIFGVLPATPEGGAAPRNGFVLYSRDRTALTSPTLAMERAVVFGTALPRFANNFVRPYNRWPRYAREPFGNQACRRQALHFDGQSKQRTGVRNCVLFGS